MIALLVVLLIAVENAPAQAQRFFRISGPRDTTLWQFTAEGYLVWSNTQPNTIYNVEAALVLEDVTNWVDYVRLPVTNSLNTNLLVSFHPPTGMNLIPAGLFTMGDAVDSNYWNNAPLTNVYVSGCYMDSNLVTYAQWQLVYNWATNHGYSFVNAGSGQGTNYPAQHMDWYDCVKWCNARSEMEGLPPVYFTNSTLTELYKTGEVDAIYVRWSTNGYRLPTEAEWEKAARGGLRNFRFPWGNTISQSQANYYSDTNRYDYDLGPRFFNPLAIIGGDQKTVFATTPVGSFAGNGYGMYDMAGNLAEWCWDWYRGDAPPGSPYAGGTDPHGPAIIGNRVVRSGDGEGYAERSCCAYRDNFNPHDFYGNLGFRCVRGL